MSDKTKVKTTSHDSVSCSDAELAKAAKIPSFMRICYTPKGPVRLTPTEMQILSFVHRHEGHPLSKSQIATALGRNEKTVSRLISQLRQYQILEIQPVFADNGAQLANIYRLVEPDNLPEKGSES